MASWLRAAENFLSKIDEKAATSLKKEDRLRGAGSVTSDSELSDVEPSRRHNRQAWDPSPSHTDEETATFVDRVRKTAPSSPSRPSLPDPSRAGSVKWPSRSRQVAPLSGRRSGLSTPYDSDASEAEDWSEFLGGGEANEVSPSGSTRSSHAGTLRSDLSLSPATNPSKFASANRRSTAVSLPSQPGPPSRPSSSPRYSDPTQGVSSGASGQLSGNSSVPPPARSPSISDPVSSSSSALPSKQDLPVPSRKLPRPALGAGADPSATAEALAAARQFRIENQKRRKREQEEKAGVVDGGGGLVEGRTKAHDSQLKNLVGRGQEPFQRGQAVVSSARPVSSAEEASETSSTPSLSIAESSQAAQRDESATGRNDISGNAEGGSPRLEVNSGSREVTSERGDLGNAAVVLASTDDTLQHHRLENAQAEGPEVNRSNGVEEQAQRDGGGGGHKGDLVNDSQPQLLRPPSFSSSFASFAPISPTASAQKVSQAQRVGDPGQVPESDQALDTISFAPAPSVASPTGERSANSQASKDHIDHRTDGEVLHNRSTDAPAPSFAVLSMSSATNSSHGSVSHKWEKSLPTPQEKGPFPSAAPGASNYYPTSATSSSPVPPTAAADDASRSAATHAVPAIAASLAADGHKSASPSRRLDDLRSVTDVRETPPSGVPFSSSAATFSAPASLPATPLPTPVPLPSLYSPLSSPSSHSALPPNPAVPSLRLSSAVDTGLPTGAAPPLSSSHSYAKTRDEVVDAVGFARSALEDVDRYGSPNDISELPSPSEHLRDREGPSDAESAPNSGTTVSFPEVAGRQSVVRGIEHDGGGPTEADIGVASRSANMEQQRITMDESNEGVAQNVSDTSKSPQKEEGGTRAGATEATFPESAALPADAAKPLAVTRPEDLLDAYLEQVLLKPGKASAPPGSASGLTAVGCAGNLATEPAGVRVPRAARKAKHHRESSGGSSAEHLSGREKFEETGRKAEAKGESRGHSDSKSSEVTQLRASKEEGGKGEGERERRASGSEQDLQGGRGGEAGAFEGGGGSDDEDSYGSSDSGKHGATAGVEML
eukprot:TRINITY_DN5681_c0_g1_i1.p1 TRINITY_DN5681_c0_g1~~TRINITY_DN5681_c0_g1_i1.p1  ORF type:complete len:1060 (+),score=185.34 TRINITY_DN5681_c0_g1_i1:112-3291(+)